MLGACTVNDPPATDARDPFEATNRRIFAFNNTVDDNVLRPVAEAYRDTLPEQLRTAIRNFLRNLNEPVILVNNVLQLRLLDAGQTLMRFYVNTTAGGLGFFDVATATGIERRPADLGQTLASWGLPDGPFLMLPLLGPTTVRDAVGDGIESFGHPISLLTGAVFSRGLSQALGIGRGTLGGLDLRAENIETLDALRNDSLDYYSRLRSVVRQRRDAELGRSGQEGEGIQPLDDPGAVSSTPPDPGAPVQAGLPTTIGGPAAELPGITVTAPSATAPAVTLPPVRPPPGDPAWVRGVLEGVREPR